ncbi:MAG TPA: SRPBCC domain-containing protein [Chloroflexia bacterium]
MDNLLHIQVELDAPLNTVLEALVDPAQLTMWFAEHAYVSPHEDWYDFWGRFTPDAPDREQGRHPIISLVPYRSLSYGWKVRGADSTVEMLVEPRDTRTLLVIRHNGGEGAEGAGIYTLEDWWFLSLENLRRHLAGKRDYVHYDFSAQPDPADIRHTIEIDAPPEKVFEALIEPKQIERWIASKATVEPHVGGRYELGWGEGAGAVKIVELEPGRKLSYSWPEPRLSEDAPPANETIVTWELEGSGGKTRLTLVHSGFTPGENIDHLRPGWLNFLSWVKSLSEFGPNWQTPVKLLPEGMAPYYPATIGARQAEVYVPVA